MTPTIREAAEGDLPGILACERRPEHRGQVGSWPIDRHRVALDSEDAHYLVALRDTQVLGFVLLLGFASEHRSIEVKRIAVAEPGSGVGGELLACALDFSFTERNAHRVALHVFETNIRAARLYRKLGFHDDGLLREAILGEDGRFHTMILMSILDREYAASRAGDPV